MSFEQVVLLSARVDSLFSFTDDDYVSAHFVCSDDDDAPMFPPNEHKGHQLKYLKKIFLIFLTFYIAKGIFDFPNTRIYKNQVIVPS